MLRDQPEDQRRIDLAQTDLGPSNGDHRPRIRPAAAMKHRQRPEIDAVVTQSEHQRVAQRLQIGAAVAVDRALRISRRAGRVEQADRLPFVVRLPPFELCIAAGHQRLIGDLTDPGRFRQSGILDLDHQHVMVELAAHIVHQRGELPVHYQHLGAAVIEREGDRRRVEPCVQRIEHGAQHGHREMCLDHLRDVRGQDRHRIQTPTPRSASAAARRVQRSCSSPYVMRRSPSMTATLSRNEAALRAES